MTGNSDSPYECIIVNEISNDIHSVESILLDFDKLNFSGCPFTYSENDINYNEGKEANPFNKIAKYYGRNENVFQFISMLRDKKIAEKIMKIISKKCDTDAKEKFTERLNIYLNRISLGENDAKEFLGNNDVLAFFNGYHVPCPGHDRNIHENLNINIKKPGCAFESKYFNRIIKRMEDEKSELRRVKIYSNGKRIATVLKNENQQRIYSFNKFASCDVEIKWNAKEKFGNIFKCFVILHVISGEVHLQSSTLNGDIVECQDILELAKQNDEILIKNKTLYEILVFCNGLGETKLKEAFEFGKENLNF